MNIKKAIPLLASLVVLAGCASGYKQFYRPTQGFNPGHIAEMRLGSPPGVPMVERAQPTESTIILDAYAKRGFVMIGSSMFNSGRAESEESAIEQGQSVGADLVLILNPRYTGSVTSSVPITTPTTTTSYSTGTAVAYGPRGSVSAFGSGTTTTYGSATTYVPMTVHRSDYGAVFFVKQRFGFGAFLRDLTDSERQELQTNKGAAIRLIVDDTPAFNADILVGDIVTSVDGTSVANSQAFQSMLRERQGKQVKLSLLRRGQVVEKSVQLGQ